MAQMHSIPPSIYSIRQSELTVFLLNFCSAREMKDLFYEQVYSAIRDMVSTQGICSYLGGFIARVVEDYSWLPYLGHWDNESKWKTNTPAVF